MIGLIATVTLLCQPSFPITDVVLNEETSALTVEGESRSYRIMNGYWSAAEEWTQGDLVQLCGYTLTNLTTNESVETLAVRR